MPMPTIEELREQYREVMEDPAVTAVSYWNMPNKDSQCDDELYLDKALENGDCLDAKINEALDGIHAKRV